MFGLSVSTNMEVPYLLSAFPSPDFGPGVEYPNYKQFYDTTPQYNRTTMGYEQPSMNFENMSANFKTPARTYEDSNEEDYVLSKQETSGKSTQSAFKSAVSENRAIRSNGNTTQASNLHERALQNKNDYNAPAVQNSINIGGSSTQPFDLYAKANHYYSLALQNYSNSKPATITSGSAKPIQGQSGLGGPPMSSTSSTSNPTRPIPQYAPTAGLTLDVSKTGKALAPPSPPNTPYSALSMLGSIAKGQGSQSCIDENLLPPFPDLFATQPVLYHPLWGTFPSAAMNRTSQVKGSGAHKYKTFQPRYAPY